MKSHQTEINAASLKTAPSQTSSCTSSQKSSTTFKEKQTYYFTKFELFEEQQRVLFYSQYRVFLDRLLLELGDDWRQEAILLAKQTGLVPSWKELFEVSLEVWLQINRMRKMKHIKEEDPTVNYDNVYYELFLKRLQDRLSAMEQHDKIKQGLSTLAMGFYYSANEIWAKLLKEKNKPKQSSAFSRIFTQNHLFRPLMRVKQRISTFFNKKMKVEVNYENSSFGKFRQSLQEEQQIEQEMRNLKLEEQSETASDVVFENIPEENPINQNILQTAYRYIQNLIGRRDKWQVARGFVTNMLEINYNKIAETFSGQNQQENKPQPSESQISVRVVKPASDFYHNLMVVWLLFRGDSDYRIKFKEYLERVKVTLGGSWRENYMEPTKIFFSNLNSQWNRLINEKESLKREDDEIIQIFVERVKENMKEEWQQKISKKQGFIK